MTTRALKLALLAGTVAMATPALAAEVTPERLVNADKEPQNWLMNHRTYDGQRYSPLDKINKGNVKSLKLAYAVPLGGKGANEFTNATPLVEDGFIYVTDSWGVLYKIDGRSGTMGRIMWRMDPQQERQLRNRGAALWGNLVITGAGVSPPRSRQGHRQGRMGDFVPGYAGRDVYLRAAADQGQDHHRRGQRRPGRA